jgi:Spy/CpxP family protein refolding chaperone
MNRMSWWGVALTVSLGAAGVGCEGSTTQTPPATAQESIASGTVTVDDDAVSAELQTRHGHHHAGFAGFVMMAIETIGVTPDQQAALDKIKADFQSKMQPVRDANGVVIQTLADGIAAGNIDAAKVDVAVAGVTTASAQVHGATVDALNQLHALLRPEQRAALVDKVDAHWTVWKQANGGDPTADNSRPDGHLAHLAAEIGLTSEQVDKVRANLAAGAVPSRAPFDPAEAEAHLKAFATAFAADTFDANALTAGAPAGARLATWGASRMARFYETLGSVLTPDQRTKVADKLRQHASEL